jgi:hypothetical protein
MAAVLRLLTSLMALRVNSDLCLERSLTDV